MVSEQISSTDFKSWDKQNIVLDYQVGAGKTHFILNTLIPFYKQQNKSILYLVNRVLLKDQIESQYEKAGAKVFTYQSIETMIRNGQQPESYDYILCDEAHYFFLDASFNHCTYLSFQWLMQQTQSTKIFMSATCDSLIQYFDDNKIPYIPYRGERDYSYIDRLTFFHGLEDMKQILRDMPSEDKVLVFTSAKNGKHLNKEFENSSFLCSESNKEYDSDKMEKLRAYIAENESFPDRILFTTIVLDNGINIVDKAVKHVIVDTFDKDTIVQCVGRRRVQDDENIYVYIHDYSSFLEYQIEKIIYEYEPARFLKEHGEREFKQRYLFEPITIGRCLYWNINPENKDALCVNECKYHFFEKCLEWIDEIKNRPERYISTISEVFGKEPDILNKETVINGINTLFSEYLNQELVGEEKEKFIKKLDEILVLAKKNKKWHINNQSYSIIQKIIWSYQLSYGIKEKKKTKAPHKGSMVWTITPRRVSKGSKRKYYLPDLKF